MAEIDVKKILVGIDFSNFTDPLIQVASHLGRAFNSAVHLIHIVPPLELPLDPEGIISGWTSFSIEEELEKQAEESLLKLAEKLRTDGVKEVDIFVMTGNPKEGYLSYAEQIGADLGIIGSHGYSDLPKFLSLGGISEGIIRGADFPVMVVKKLEDREKGIEEILLAVDFSENSKKAALWAAYFADRLRAKVRALYVMPDFAKLALSSESKIELDRSEEKLRAEIEKRLADWLADLGLSGAVTEVKKGDADRSIAEASEKADLVIMGKRGQSGLKRLFMGSITEKVLRASRTDVLVVHQAS